MKSRDSCLRRNDDGRFPLRQRQSVATRTLDAIAADQASWSTRPPEWKGRSPTLTWFLRRFAVTDDSRRKFGKSPLQSAGKFGALEAANHRSTSTGSGNISAVTTRPACSKRAFDHVFKANHALPVETGHDAIAHVAAPVDADAHPHRGRPEHGVRRRDAENGGEQQSAVSSTILSRVSSELAAGAVRRSEPTIIGTPGRTPPGCRELTSPRAHPGRRSSMATTGQKLAVTRAYQNAPLKPNGEVSAYLTPRNCSVAFCSLPG